MRPLRRALVTACALTKTTDLVARYTGARWFLPEVLVHRFAGLGGFEIAEFTAQIDNARSFSDQGWTEHWERLAADRTATAYRALTVVAAERGERLPQSDVLFGADAMMFAELLGRLLGPAAEFVGDRGPAPGADAVERFLSGRPVDAGERSMVVALDVLVKAIVYHLVAAWPGATAARLRAYRTSRRLFEVLLTALGPWLGVEVEAVEIPAGSEIVRAITVFPTGTRRCPVLLVTNGLDGTVQELVLPLLKYRNAGLGMLIMEMPGSYTAPRPMSAASEEVYRSVLDYLSAHRRVDAGRIAMFGMSFGGYWAARLAAVDARLRCAVCVGTPTHRGFGPAAAIGMPQPVLRAMGAAVGAGSMLGIGGKLAALSLRGMYQRIGIPLLVVNGEHDAVIDVRDSMELAAAVPGATLRLYPDDDHCAPGHFVDWLDDAVAWLWRGIGGRGETVDPHRLDRRDSRWTCSPAVPAPLAARN
ncbi:alpha/beta hydrolase family protein [Nocardia sp. CA-128927]|uniref:alpha/beta hydrolase family protein n=1 Tax=Nocardia sp. CA-128927 TaxID=3239975 RepID=UPI003D964211